MPAFTVGEHAPSRRIINAAHRFVWGLAISVNTQLSSLLTCQMCSSPGIDGCEYIQGPDSPSCTPFRELYRYGSRYPDVGTLNRLWDAGLADRLTECHPGCLVSCKRFDGGCVSACLVASAADQSPLLKVETACSPSQSQLIMAGYTLRALLLRLHSPHKSPPCKGQPQLVNYHILIRQASLASSASTRHFRLHPALRGFVSCVALFPR